LSAGKSRAGWEHVIASFQENRTQLVRSTTATKNIATNDYVRIHSGFNFYCSIIFLVRGLINNEIYFRGVTLKMNEQPILYWVILILGFMGVITVFIAALISCYQ
jgi:hypothetical protein